MERLAADYPFVRFILLNEPLNTGSQINLAAAEIQSGSFFVLRKDCILEPTEAAPLDTAARTAALMAEKADALCAAPRMFGSGKNVLPVQPALEFSRGVLRTKLTEPVDGARNVFPFEGIGVYNRTLFVRLGGYDNSIPDEYWQLMDFGLRACLWGENIVSTGTIRLTRSGKIAEYPAIIDESYRRCYLKNILPVYRLDAAYLPLRRFLTFLSRSGLSFPHAWEEFSAARRWVNQNAYRWKRDARALSELWGAPADIAANIAKKEPGAPVKEPV
jgi:hypothetical protein